MHKGRRPPADAKALVRVRKAAASGPRFRRKSSPLHHSEIRKAQQDVQNDPVGPVAPPLARTRLPDAATPPPTRNAQQSWCAIEHINALARKNSQALRCIALHEHGHRRASHRSGLPCTGPAKQTQGQTRRAKPDGQTRRSSDNPGGPAWKPGALAAQKRPGRISLRL